MKTRIEKLSIFASLLVGLAATTAPAFADDDAYCGNIPRSEWKTISEAGTAVEAKGYQVRDIETDDSCFEVKASKQSGERVKLYLNPRTLDIVRTKSRS